jgi:hypothetical protein
VIVVNDKVEAKAVQGFLDALMGGGVSELQHHRKGA